MRARDRGFTLLEVLVALAILAGALVVVVNIVTRNVRATNHARLVTTATFLARAKIVDVEDQVAQTGFVGDNSEEDGDFREEGFPAFTWHTSIEKLELPMSLAQDAQDQASKDSTSTNPMTAMSGLMGGFMSTLIDPIRIGLEESIRRLTVKVTWDEIGSGDRSIEVQTFVTDPAKLDMAIGGGAAMGAAGAGGTGAAAGASGTAARAGSSGGAK